jgi:hypothetical protein
MTFKGQNLETGDFVSLKTDTVPLPEVQAVVIDVENGVLEVLSTFLAPFRHSGRFTENDVSNIMVVYPAEVAIPRESGKRCFLKNQKVFCIVNGRRKYQGRVVAAFDGIVVIRTSDDQLIAGGASHFNAV